MKKLFVMLILPAILLLSGCESPKQVSERIFVRMLSLEKTEDGILASMQTFRTEDADENSAAVPKYDILSGTGASLDEALGDIQAHEGKSVFLGNCALIIANRSVLSDEALLESLTDKRVSGSCTIMYSFSPTEALSAANEDGIPVNADKRIAVFEHYANDGIIIPVTLLEAIAAVKSSDTLIIPCTDSSEEGLAGCAVITDRGLFTLDRDETEILSLLRGSDNVRMTMHTSETAGTVRISKMKYTADVEPQSERFLCRINISYSCKIESSIAGMSESAFKTAADEELRSRISDFLHRANDMGYLEIIINDEAIRENPEMKAEFYIISV